MNRTIRRRDFLKRSAAASGAAAGTSLFGVPTLLAQPACRGMDTDVDKSLYLEEFEAGQKKPPRPAGKKSRPKRVKSAVKE